MHEIDMTRSAGYHCNGQGRSCSCMQASGLVEEMPFIKTIDDIAC